MLKVENWIGFKPCRRSLLHELKNQKRKPRRRTSKLSHNMAADQHLQEIFRRAPHASSSFPAATITPATCGRLRLRQRSSRSLRFTSFPSRQQLSRRFLRVFRRDSSSESCHEGFCFSRRTPLFCRHSIYSGDCLHSAGDPPAQSSSSGKFLHSSSLPVVRMFRL